jgi:general secretion pathway protein A
MYERFFGLRERPFQLTPDPRFLYLTPRHREALATLRYGLSGPRGITLLLGEAGTGKTTLLRAALHDERQTNNRHVLLSNPTLTRTEFYEYLAEGFRIPKAAASKAKFLLDLQEDIARRSAIGGMSAIVIDEAQSLPYELLEEVRLLANLETDTTKLLNVVMVGQQELAERLNDVSLRQLKQRISLRCRLEPLELRETASYIATRIRVAGGDASTVFTKQAVLAIHEISSGIPRTIGVICDNALVGGFAAQERPVDVGIIEEVCHDFDLRPEAVGVGEAPVNGSAVTTPNAGIPMRPPAVAAPGRAADAYDGADDGRPHVPIAVGQTSDTNGRAPMFSSFEKKKRRFSFF